MNALGALEIPAMEFLASHGYCRGLSLPDGQPVWKQPSGEGPAPLSPISQVVAVLLWAPKFVFRPRKRMSSYFQLKWGVLDRYRTFSTRTKHPRSDSAKFRTHFMTSVERYPRAIF